MKIHEPNNGKCDAYAYTSWNNNINGMPWFITQYTFFHIYSIHPKKQWKKK